MNWLARLDVNAEIARKEKIADSYAWHGKLWECFPGMPNKKRTEVGFLTRIDPFEGAFRLWVLTKEKPLCPSWCTSEGFALKEISPSFLSHQYYAFDFKANPVKTIVQRGPNGETLYKPSGKRRSGKRVPLVKHEDLNAWLLQRAETGGFRIVENKPLEISPMIENHFRKRDKETGEVHVAYHGGVQFRGTLEVIDRGRFVGTYETGVGSAKGFGFGLLLLAPVRL